MPVLWANGKTVVKQVFPCLKRDLFIYEDKYIIGSYGFESFNSIVFVFLSMCVCAC